MNKLCAFIILSFFSLAVKGQDKKNAPGEEPYGQVSIADLKMTSCDFEKDANAEVLFDKATVHSGAGLTMERHIRIKIFNDFGKHSADIHMAYHTGFGEFRGIAGIEGETFNLDEKGAVVITPLESNQIFTEKINKSVIGIVFSLPNVKAGSVIEYKYRTFPQMAWFFQGELPTRYSHIEDYTYSHSLRMKGFKIYASQEFVKDNSDDPKAEKKEWAMANIHSLPNEPYMTSRKTNLQRIESTYMMFGTLSGLGADLAKYKGFGLGLDAALPGEDLIIKKAAQLTGDEEKIAFIFDTVKNCMKWNNNRSFF